MLSKWMRMRRREQGSILEGLKNCRSLAWKLWSFFDFRTFLMKSKLINGVNTQFIDSLCSLLMCIWTYGHFYHFWSRLKTFIHEAPKFGIWQTGIDDISMWRGLFLRVDFLARLRSSFITSAAAILMSKSEVLWEKKRRHTSRIEKIGDVEAKVRRNS